MSKSLKIVSLILICLSLVLIYRTFTEYKVFVTGKVIKVFVEEIPISCDVSNKSLKAYFVFSFGEKKFTKNIKGEKYCNLRVGDSLLLKTNDVNSIFVYEDETFLLEFLSCFILLFISIYIYYRASNY